MMMMMMTVFSILLHEWSYILAVWYILLLTSEEIMKWLESEDTLMWSKCSKRSLMKLGVMLLSWCYVTALDTSLIRRWLRQKIPRMCWCVR